MTTCTQNMQRAWWPMVNTATVIGSYTFQWRQAQQLRGTISLYSIHVEM